jgi:hypothetical protein
MIRGLALQLSRWYKRRHLAAQGFFHHAPLPGIA